MSLVTFYYKNQPRGKIGGIRVDATISDGLTLTSAISKYPVEDGSNISDNITIEPGEMNIRGLVTDTPFFLPDTHENANFKKGEESRVKTAYEALLALHANREPFNIVTGLDVYTNVFFTSLEISRDSNTGEALVFDGKFQKIIFATPVIVKIPKEKIRNGKKDLAVSDVKKGAGQASDAESKRPNVSLLYKEFGGLLGKAIQ